MDADCDCDDGDNDIAFHGRAPPAVTKTFRFLGSRTNDKNNASSSSLLLVLPSLALSENSVDDADDGGNKGNGFEEIATLPANVNVIIPPPPPVPASSLVVDPDSVVVESEGNVVADDGVDIDVSRVFNNTIDDDNNEEEE